MSTEANFLDIVLLGKEYRVACPPEERTALEAAVALVDARMHDIAEKTKSNAAERIAVMAALNIAHEHLSEKMNADSALEPGEKVVQQSVDFEAAKGRISDMEAQLEAVLMPQQELLQSE